MTGVLSDEQTDRTAAALESLLASAQQDRYVLRLYVTGMTERSMRAIETLKAICEQHLAGRYDLEVIDLLDKPDLAEEKQIVVTPTLIKELPGPVRRLVGDLSQPGRVIMVLT